jgi:hypothetical protein
MLTTKVSNELLKVQLSFRPHLYLVLTFFFSWRAEKEKNWQKTSKHEKIKSKDGRDW